MYSFKFEQRLILSVGMVKCRFRLFSSHNQDSFSLWPLNFICSKREGVPHLGQSQDYKTTAMQAPGGLQESQVTRVRSLGWDDPLEEGMATHSSILAWRIQWTEEPGGRQSIGQQSWTGLNQFSMACTHIHQDNPFRPPLCSWSEVALHHYAKKKCTFSSVQSLSRV